MKIIKKSLIKMKNTTKSLFIVWIFVFPSIMLIAQGSVIGPQDAVNLVLENHPELKMSDLQFNLAETKFDQARQVPATSFSLSIGQTNTSLIDYNFLVNQSLGAIGADRKRRNVALQEVVLANQQKNVKEVQLANRVQKLWFLWSYFAARSRILDRQLSLYELLEEKTQAQFDAGEIDRLQLSIANSKIIQLSRLISKGKAEEEAAGNELATAAWITERNIQIDTQLVILPFPANLEVNEQLLRPLEQEQLIAEAQIQVSEKELAPQWNFGYFNQSIRPDYSLQGINIGTLVPLFKKAGKAKIEEDRVRKMIADQRFEQTRQELSWQLDKIEQIAIRYNNYLRGPATQLLEESGRLRSLADTQLLAGEIDFFQYLQSIDVAFQNELEYLEAVNQYNQAIIDLRFLVR